MFYPSPIGVVMTAGTWLFKEKEKVYYIEVVGQGSSFEEAKLNGFRLAVEQAVGSVIASETVAENSRLKRDEIISYASGYVDQFELGSTASDGRLVKVPMKVWIKRSVLANRLLNESKTATNVEGTRVAVQFDTLVYERGQADRLLTTVLNDYPKRAFNIIAKPVQATFDSNRQVAINVRYDLQWNADYLASLREALERTAQNPNAGGCWNNWNACRNSGYVKIEAKPGFFGWQNVVGYDDRRLHALVVQHLVESQPAVLVTIRDSMNTVVHRSCRQIPEQMMVIQGPWYTHVNGKFVFSNATTVNVGQNAESLSALQAVDLQVVRAKDCSI